jgi:hypothetical protein
MIEADLGYQIDNMEGINHRTVGGETIITKLYPTTISVLQRSLLRNLQWWGGRMSAPL